MTAAAKCTFGDLNFRSEAVENWLSHWRGILRLFFTALNARSEKESPPSD
jgi:hypothetical protein